ncbi:sulfatase [Fulvivirga sp. M361]|uniref:sulfatase family protein n=1 Tax=Fulvivirga sp. M361 TaxID=2594266 RepID=UPI00117990B4|nr:sulfatase [Fulvivirga sp. M361]TRX54769.1 sulfatase [Fulvivirga sp. M361]
MKTLAYILLTLVFSVKFVSGQEKPNILWITIEDTSPQFIGCYGNKNARTPVIDQLASEGVRFTGAFSTGTVCSPSRSAIITGVPTFKMGTGNHRSTYPIPDFIHGFPHYLQQQGYYTSNNSKTDYNVANEKDFIKDAWDESSNKAGWWNRDADQPFFAVFNYAASHQSRTMSMPYEWYVKNVWDHLPEQDRIAEDAFDMPPFYRDTPEMRKQFARVYNSIKLTDNRIGKLLERLEKDGLREHTIVFFYADHGEGIPRAKTNGIGLGYRVPFVVWFPEKYKHLSPWGTAGVVTDELISFEDLAPTMVRLAGGEVPEYMKGRTLMGENRSKPVDHLVLSADRADNGPDLVRSVTDGKFIYSRNYMPFMPEMRYIRYVDIAEITQHMRSDLLANSLDPLQQSIFGPRPDEFLFDLEKDPWEINNLVEKSEYKDILSKMRRQLNARMLESRDAHFLPEYEIGLISENRTLYEYRLDQNLYPFEEIYAAASLSGRRGKEIAKRQVSLLKSKNNIIRYWAITGLLSQGDETLQPYKKDLLAAMEDTYPPVSITASAIVYRQFNEDRSVEQLKLFCSNDNAGLALMAINHLLYLDEKQPFVETVKAVHATSKRPYIVKAACMDFLGTLDLVPNAVSHEQ